MPEDYDDETDDETDYEPEDDDEDAMDDFELESMAARFATVPNCETPDCEWKACTWASTSFCGACLLPMIGEEEMRRRYSLTHEKPWHRKDEGDCNPMTAEWPTRM